jgi:hypothetical protein
VFYGLLRLFLCIFFLFLPFTLSSCYSQNSEVIKSDRDKPETGDPFLWDFGKVKRTGILTHSFIIKNNFNQILNIKKVNTSCGCTASEVKKKTLMPGEDTLLEVRFDTKGYSGPTQQYIYVHTDNLDNPILRFTIKADVVKN